VADRGGGGVGDVEERDRYGRLHLVGQLVHGVGAEHQCLGAAALQAPGGVDQQPGGAGPVAGVLALGDVGEIEGPEQQPRGVQPAQAFPIRVPAALACKLLQRTGSLTGDAE